jgi:hypothetical protein
LMSDNCMAVSLSFGWTAGWPETLVSGVTPDYSRDSAVGRFEISSSAVRDG